MSCDNIKFNKNISIHALVKRATGRYVYFERLSSDFNPRPREEGDFAPSGLTWSSNSISIHALVKRATKAFTIFCGKNWHFNPRPREEGDQAVLFLYGFYAEISIHALVKRATPSIYCVHHHSRFQSTPS